MNSKCHPDDMVLGDASGMISRGAVFHGAGRPLTVEAFEVPPLSAGEVLVEVECATICRSDIHTFEGRRQEPVPLVLGHEMTGRVAAVGGADAPFAGQRVVWPMLLACGGCYFCKRDLPSACDGRFKFGHEQRPLSGGFAEHCVLPAGTPLFPVPPGMPAEVAALAVCAGATAAAVIRKAGLANGDTVMILGAGAVGLIACGMAVALGAQVIAVDPDESRVAAARQLGAADPSMMPARGCDCALDLAGGPGAAGQGLQHLRKGGHLVLAGTVFPGPPLALAPDDVVRRQLCISGVYNYAPRDLETALRFLGGGATARLLRQNIEGRYALNEINQAFAHARQRHPLRVAIYPNQPS